MFSCRLIRHPLQSIGPENFFQRFEDETLDEHAALEIDDKRAEQAAEKAPTFFVIPSEARNLSFFSWG
jgi:hypothetical protein